MLSEANNIKMQIGSIQENFKDKVDGIDYSPGVGFDSNNDATSKKNKGSSSRSNKSKLEKTCNSCRMKGHSWRSHHHCLNYVGSIYNIQQFDPLVVHTHLY